MPPRIFLLSPANSAGVKAQGLLHGSRTFELAQRLRSPAGAAIGEVYAYLSSLYFRGKLAYARKYGRGANGLAGAYAITTDRGLVPVETPITQAQFRAMGEVPIDAQEPRYTQPLVASAQALARYGGKDLEVVLLGSIATGKYVDLLLPVFGSRLRFPGDFVGRGDMSRGGLLLRCVAEGHELTYIPVQDAVRKGARPPKLPPKARALSS